ncbi:hypothetical protein BJV77DRAFT_963617 [Russula vinacea]|nr:hypothetical protein BJV77DRAFT_963617 [Russula vinacea]
MYALIVRMVALRAGSPITGLPGGRSQIFESRRKRQNEKRSCLENKVWKQPAPPQRLPTFSMEFIRTLVKHGTIEEIPSHRDPPINFKLRIMKFGRSEVVQAQSFSTSSARKQACTSPSLQRAKPNCVSDFTLACLMLESGGLYSQNTCETKAQKPPARVHTGNLNDSRQSTMDSCQALFLPSGQEGKAIIRISVVLKEGTRDAVVICAFCPERLEPWKCWRNSRHRAAPVLANVIQ